MCLPYSAPSNCITVSVLSEPSTSPPQLFPEPQYGTHEIVLPFPFCVKLNTLLSCAKENSIELMRYIEVIEKELDAKADINFLPKQPGDVIKSEADSGSLEKFISFKPSTSIEHGIKEFINWYKQYYGIG